MTAPTPAVVVVATSDGPVTSYREAWKDDDGRTVWTWRTDGGTPHDFGTVAAAEAWIDEVVFPDPKARVEFSVSERSPE